MKGFGARTHMADNWGRGFFFGGGGGRKQVNRLRSNAYMISREIIAFTQRKNETRVWMPSQLNTMSAISNINPAIGCCFFV
jgi:hypothetical protein